MTEMLQKSENVAKNVANKNSQDLTEQWKKGELPEGFYFVNDGAEVTIDYYLCDYWERHLDSHIHKILAPVATFEEWEQLENWADFTNDYHELREKLEIAEYKNAQLKEQINKYYLDVINRGTANAVKAVKEFGMPERIKELVEQNAQLKELLRIILSKTETCYSMVFQKDIITAELNKTLLKKIDEVLK